MKKIVLVSSLLIVIFFGTFQNSFAAKSAPSIINITIVSKAYWDGTSKSCLSRDHGCCIHIEIGGGGLLAPGKIIGTITSSGSNTLLFSFSKSSGITPATFADLFKNGQFILDGTGTFAEDLLSQLGLSSSFTLSSGNYSYSQNGDTIVVSFKY